MHARCMWSIRSSSSKTFACASHSFDSSKCFTNSAIHAASSSTSASVDISRLDRLRHFGRADSGQLAREPKDFGKQLLNAGTQMHSEISFHWLNRDNKYLR